MINVIASLVSSSLGFFFDSPEVKAQKAANKVEIEKKKLELELQKMTAQAKAESDYDNKAQDNMKTSWKDEYLIILHTLPIWGYIVPSEEFHKGLDRIWSHLENAPYEWWLIYMGIVASTFGLRWLFTKRRLDKILERK